MLVASSLSAEQGRVVLSARRRAAVIKEKQNVSNHIDFLADFDAAGFSAHLAAQPELGLLPEWRTWFHSIDSDNPRADGPALAWRNVR